MSVLNKYRLTGIEDIRALIGANKRSDVMPDRTISLGSCGMGMPVLTSNEAITLMEPGQILKLESGHP